MHVNHVFLVQYIKKSSCQGHDIAADDCVTET